MNSTVYLIAALLVAFQIKHFLADYIWQGDYQLGKFKPGWDFLGPLASHCWTHALCTLVVFSVALGYLTPQAGWGETLSIVLPLAGIDFVLHFIMDRLKAGPKYMGRWKPLDAKSLTDAKWLLSQPDDGRSHRVALVALRRNKFFWWALGFDQGFHHLTHYALIALFLFMVGA